MAKSNEEKPSNLNFELGIVGPLNFSDQQLIPIQKQLFPSEVVVPCLFCNKTFTFYAEKHDYLAHLYLNHRLIIGDEDQVAIFHEYLLYWRQIFSGEGEKMPEFCTMMVMDQLPDGTPSKNEKYYLLCDVLPQDNELRQKLRTKQLDFALAQHQFERTDDKFERSCLFCREIIKTKRCDFIEHLFRKHFLQLGKPENLIFIDELIETIQVKLDKLVCLFCEKTFKDRSTLKEHMRKKGHKRINPDNKTYDRFFLINYQNQQSCSRKGRKPPPQRVHKDLEMKQKNEKESHSILEHDSDSNWSDWEGDEQDIKCLFCPMVNCDFIKLKQHIIMEHGIDFDKETENMTFYDRIKIVNFIRRKIYALQCIKCNERFQKSLDLQAHMKENNHYCLGDVKDWNLPQYFFPTYEDDAFLCHLSDDDTFRPDSKPDDSIVVYAEDSNVCINSDAEALSKERIEII